MAKNVWQSSDEKLGKPADNVPDLLAQLELSIFRVEEAQFFSDYILALLAIAWQEVAEGDLEAPRKILQRIYDDDYFTSFVDFIEDFENKPNAVILRGFLDQLEIASEALEFAVLKNKLLKPEALLHKIILQLLWDKKPEYLSIEEVHSERSWILEETIRDIMQELADKFLLIGITLRIKKEKYIKKYALSETGKKMCEQLGLTQY